MRPTPWLLAGLLALGPGAASFLPGCSKDGRRQRTLEIYVDGTALVAGDGSRAAPFQTIQAGVAEARSQVDSQPGVRVVVRIAALPAGEQYSVDPAAPLLIDRPMELRGSGTMGSSGSGLPTGISADETPVVAVPALGSDQTLLEIAADDVSIKGLSLSAGGAAGAGFATLFVRDAERFLIQGNLFVGEPAVAIQTVASSGLVFFNRIEDAGCGICLVGGDISAFVQVTNNRVLASSAGGVELLGWAELPGTRLSGFATGNLVAQVFENDLNGASPPTGSQGFSYGVRVAMARDTRYLQAMFDPLAVVRGSVSLRVDENLLQDNYYGISIDAGAPAAADPRRYTGHLDVSAADNDFTNSTAQMLVSFTRSSRAADPTDVAWKYSEDARIDLLAVRSNQADIWIDHPDSDGGGPLGNALFFNGQPVDAPLRTVPDPLP